MDQEYYDELHRNAAEEIEAMIDAGQSMSDNYGLVTLQPTSAIRRAAAEAAANVLLAFERGVIVGAEGVQHAG